MRAHRGVLCALALLGAEIIITASAEERQVTLTGDPWPPYVEGELGTMATGGIAVWLVERIFERIVDVTPTFPLVPWERALREVEAGTMDGIVILAKTPERERYMVYTEPLMTSRNLVWYTEERFPEGFQWSSVEDFSGHLVGVVRGYDYGADIDNAIVDGTLSVVAVNDTERLFTMLARGRLDLALANDNVGMAQARRRAGEATIRAADRPTAEDVYYMAFSRRSDAARLVDPVNRVLADLRREWRTDVPAEEEDE